VSDDLVRQVGLVLLQMPNKHPAAVAAKYDSWTLPYDYQPVHELLQQLQHSPYEHFGDPTMASIYDKYRLWIWTLGSLSLIVIGLVFAILLINRNLKKQVKRNASLLRELKHAAAHDGLTGVYNRSYFMQLLTDTLSRLRRHDGSLGLAFIDLDNFKAVNDSYGHDAGDNILCGVVDIIRSYTREYDFIGRFGGDEFVIAFEDVHSLDELRGILQRMQASIIAAQLVDDELNFAATAGCVLASAKEINSAKRLLMVSDQLMYLAKSHEPGGLEVQHYRDSKQEEQDDIIASVARFRRDFDESE
jgi:diguanylate cyclase (GGDEF)-like protein